MPKVSYLPVRRNRRNVKGQIRRVRSGKHGGQFSKSGRAALVARFPKRRRAKVSHRKHARKHTHRARRPRFAHGPSPMRLNPRRRRKARRHHAWRKNPRRRRSHARRHHAPPRRHRRRNSGHRRRGGVRTRTVVIRTTRHRRNPFGADHTDGFFKMSTWGKVGFGVLIGLAGLAVAFGVPKAISYFMGYSPPSSWPQLGYTGLLTSAASVVGVSFLVSHFVSKGAGVALLIAGLTGTALLALNAFLGTTAQTVIPVQEAILAAAGATTSSASAAPPMPAPVMTTAQANAALNNNPGGSVNLLTGEVLSPPPGMGNYNPPRTGVRVFANPSSLNDYNPSRTGVPIFAYPTSLGRGGVQGMGYYPIHRQRF
jgi:hypothetical protein